MDPDSCDLCKNTEGSDDSDVEFEDPDFENSLKEFVSRLNEIHQNTTQKLIPNLSKDWIERIRKSIKTKEHRPRSP